MSVQRISIPSLTGLRFFAAGLIVYAHTILTYKSIPGEWIYDSLRISRLGMTLFFVLSGFVIQYNYGEKLATWTPIEIWRFFVARVARLYPLFLLALAIEMALYVPNILAFDRFGRVWPYYLTLSQDWFGIDIDNKRLTEMYVAGAWSISAEIFLYLLFIPLARPIAYLKTVRAAAIAIVALSVAAGVFFLGSSAGLWCQVADPYWAFYLSPYCRFPEFLLGALTSVLFTNLAGRKTPAAEIRIATAAAYLSFAWMGALFLATYLQQHRAFVYRMQDSWGFAVPCAILIFVLARYPTPLRRFVENRPVLMLGEASYSLYLIHSTMIWFFTIGGKAEGFALAIRIPVMWTVIAIVALGFYTYFEVPARRFVRQSLNLRAEPSG